MAVDAGKVQLDLQVRDRVAAQVNDAAAQTANTAKAAFAPVEKTISDALTKPIDAAQKKLKAARWDGATIPKSLTDPSAPAESAAVDPEVFTPATESAELLRQKLTNINLQIDAQTDKLRMLTEQYSKMGDADVGSSDWTKLSSAITTAEGRLISLQSSAMATQAKIDKPVSDAAAKVKSTASKASADVKQSVKSAGKSIEKTAKSTADKAQQHAKKASSGIGLAATKLGKTIKSVFKATFLTAALYAVFRGVKAIISGATAQNKEFAASATAIKTNLSAAFMPIMDAILPALNALMSGLASATKYVTTFVAAMMGQTYDQAVAAAKKLKDVKDAAKDAGTTMGIDQLNVVSGGDDAMAEYSAMEAGGSAAAESLADKFKTAFSGIQDGLKTALKRFEPSIQAWGAAFEKLKKPVSDAMSSARNSVSKLWRDSLRPFGSYLMTDFVPGVVNDFSVNLAPVFSDVMSLAVSEWAKDFEFSCQQVKRVIDDILKPAFDFVKNVWHDVTASFKSNWDLYGQPLIDKFQAFKNSLREIWNYIYDSIIKPIVDKVWDKINNLWTEHLAPLWDKIVKFGMIFGTMVMDIWNKYLSPLVKFLISDLAPKVRWVADVIGDVVGTVVGMVSDWLGGVIDALSGLCDFISGVFTGDWEKAWQGIKDYFRGCWQAILGIGVGAVNLLIDAVNGLWTGIYVVITSIANSLGKALSAIGDLLGKDWGWHIDDDAPKIPHIPMPEIPQLALGGIVSAPTLAMIGEGRSSEAVVPLNDQTFAALAAGINRIGGDNADAILQLLREILEWLRSYDPDVRLYANNREIARAANDGNKALGYPVATRG